MLAPALAPHEAERRKMIHAGAVGVAVVTGLGLVLGVAAWGIWSKPGLVIVGLLLPAMIYGNIAWQRVQKFQAACKAEALTALARAIGLTYQCEGFTPYGFDRLQELGLLPHFERSHFEDRFSGRRDGCDFMLYEAKLEDQRGEGKNRHWVVVFGGQIIRIGFPKPFLGTTVVNRQSLLGWRHDGFQRVILESNQFEKIFEVYGTDQVEARYLVHPAFMERLTALEAALGGERIRCAFDGGDLMLLVEGGDLFEIVNAFRPLPDRETTRAGVEGIVHVLKLIDAILAPPSNPYASPPTAAEIDR